MIRQFFRDAGVYGLSTVGVRAAQILLIPLYVRLLTPSDFGVVEMWMIATSLVNLLVALEVSQGVARFFPNADTQSDRQGYASTGLWFTIIMYSLLAFGAIVGANRLSPWVFGRAAPSHVFVTAVVCIWVGGLSRFGLNQIKWQLQ